MILVVCVILFRGIRHSVKTSFSAISYLLPDLSSSWGIWTDDLDVEVPSGAAVTPCVHPIAEFWLIPCTIPCRGDECWPKRSTSASELDSAFGIVNRKVPDY